MMNRRNFLATGLATSTIPFVKKFTSPKMDKVRLAFIGVGLRGRNHLSQVMFRDDVEVVALCDIDPDAIKKSLDIISKNGRKSPTLYGKSEKDYENMLKRDDIDGVVVSTPWEWHVPMSVASMKAGKIVGSIRFITARIIYDD